MAIETTPKDITPIKRKGIEMAVKGLHKKYPFIIGYKDDTTDQYQSAHYVDLIIDLQKLSDYMDTPINPYWSNELINDPSFQKVYALWTYLKFPNEVNYGDDITKHPGYLLQNDVKETLETVYEYLPEEYKLYYQYETEWSTEPLTYPVGLKINGYLMR